jgi:hypothetical protein
MSVFSLCSVRVPPLAHHPRRLFLPSRNPFSSSRLNPEYVQLICTHIHIKDAEYMSTNTTHIHIHIHIQRTHTGEGEMEMRG